MHDEGYMIIEIASALALVVLVYLLFQDQSVISRLIRCTTTRNTSMRSKSSLRNK